MIDRTPPPPGTVTVPAFEPVPRHWNRHDGWTPERQQGFIAALLETGSVKAAAQAVNMATEGVYQLRRHPKAASFRKAWEQALNAGVQRLEDLALERALNGTEVPVYSYGKLIGTRIVHNDRLLMFLLRNRAPARFAATQTRHGMVSPAELKRLKKQWRAEWEQELAETHARLRPAPLPDQRTPQPLDDGPEDDTFHPSPRTVLLSVQCQLSLDEDSDRGSDWWQQPGAIYRDGTPVADFPPIEECGPYPWA